MRLACIEKERSTPYPVRVSDTFLHHASFLFVFLAGRVLLAWLPPGNIGGHRPSSIGITLVASVALGLLASFALSPLPPLAAWIAIGVALALRLMSQPAAMVSRHEPVAPRATLASRALLGAVVLLLALLAAQATQTIEFSAWQVAQPIESAAQLRSVLAAAGIACCFVYAGRIARRSPAFTLALVLLILISPNTAKSLFASPAAVEQAFLLAAGAAFSIAWLRRGDKRARLLANIAFTGLATFGEQGLPFALAGWAGLVAFTPKPSFFATARLWLLGLGFALLFGQASIAQIPTRPTSGVLDTLLALSELNAYPLIVALTLVGFLLYALKKTPGAAGIDPPRREGGAAFFMLACALLASPWQAEKLLPLAILMALAALLSLVPAVKSSAAA